jgi:hypothetical protein
MSGTTSRGLDTVLTNDEAVGPRTAPGQAGEIVAYSTVVKGEGRHCWTTGGRHVRQMTSAGEAGWSSVVAVEVALDAEGEARCILGEAAGWTPVCSGAEVGLAGKEGCSLPRRCWKGKDSGIRGGTAAVVVADEYCSFPMQAGRTAFDAGCSEGSCIAEGPQAGAGHSRRCRMAVAVVAAAADGTAVVAPAVGSPPDVLLDLLGHTPALLPGHTVPDLLAEGSPFSPLPLLSPLPRPSSSRTSPRTVS